MEGKKGVLSFFLTVYRITLLEAVVLQLFNYPVIPWCITVKHVLIHINEEIMKILLKNP